MTNNKESRRGSKFGKYMRAPLRFLTKVKDMYVRGMIHCSQDLAFVDANMGIPTQIYNTPNSFSSATPTINNDDFNELVTAALRVRSGGNGVELDAEAMKKPPQKSHSVGMERIEEEDEACEIGDDDDGDIKAKAPQSRSCAIP